MSRTAFPLLVFAAVAAAIAVAAFGLARLWPGAGMILTLATASIWTAFVVRHGKWVNYRHG